MFRKRLPLVLACAVFLVLPTALCACMWDYDTLKMERTRFPSALELITGKFLRHSPEFYRWRIQDREQRLRDHPNDLALYDDLGVAYDKIDNDDKAIELMLEKNRRVGGQYETYANLGTFYLHSGQYEKGVTMIDQALALNPDAHFGREKYQKYLAEYVASRRKDGKVKLPLGRDTPSSKIKEPKDEQVWTNYLSLHQADHFNLYLAKREGVHGWQEVDSERAIKGVLGMMKFGKHDSPILLEVLAELLVLTQTHGNSLYGTGKELAARAYLKASYEVKDDETREAYRKLAAKSIFMRQPNHFQLTLAETEADFKAELADADAWYADLREKEIGWIHDGKNPEAEFDKLYASDPVAVSPQETRSPLTIAEGEFRFRARLLMGGIVAIVYLSAVALFFALKAWSRKWAATKASAEAAKYSSPKG